MARKASFQKRWIARPAVARLVGVLFGVTLTVLGLSALRRGEPDYFNFYRQRVSAHFALVLGIVVTIVAVLPEPLQRRLREIPGRLPSPRSILRSRRLQHPAARIARNQPCPCGSGRKYKRCCLPADQQSARARRHAASSAAVNQDNAVTSGTQMANRGLHGR